MVDVCLIISLLLYWAVLALVLLVKAPFALIFTNYTSSDLSDDFTLINSVILRFAIKEVINNGDD